MDANSKSRAAKNIAVTGSAQAWRVLTGFILTVVTTRLLTPTDFGILAMAATATALIALVKDLGIGQALVQSLIQSVRVRLILSSGLPFLPHELSRSYLELAPPCS